ncbi:hypothetical protein MKW92_015275 [Papaver armeniacum]|nr:hypothetical protein MKW92_015275 [Papaver armeniacum]
MEIIRRRSPGFFTSSSSHVFAILAICVLLSTEMAAAWKRDICIPGDVYIDSRNHPAKGTGCEFCENWCSKQCLDLELPAVSYGCLVAGDTDIRCKCCCGRSLSSSESSSTLPTLLNRPESEFNGGWPHDYNICQSGEDHEKVERVDGRFCIKNPSCEEKCRKKGRWLTRAECVAGGQAVPNPSYKWYEQCCCGLVKPPPPPSPPPPPPSPSPPKPPPPPPSPSPPTPPPPSPPQWCTVMPSPLCLPPFQTNMCRSEDTYVAFKPRGGCGICPSECNTKCSGLDSPTVLMQRCTADPTSQLCECCCENNTPSTPRPSPRPQTPPVDTCNAVTEDAFIPTVVTDCSFCTNEYCEEKCSASGVIFTRMECASSKCNCWFRTIPQPLSTNALGSSLCLETN